ncbi:MAG: DUF3450 family protein [Campylobacterota bacterium]|nr:DUF3450 family protein [Campylobacterota bacterium]
MIRKTLLATSLVVSAMIVNADEVKNIKSISSELVKVREDIESLHSKISFEKLSYRDNLRAYSNQKSDLDTKISRSELRIKELQRDLDKITQENKEKSSSQKKLTPILKNSIKDIRETVKNSLPFKLENRLQSLKDIEHRLDTNIITPNKAVNQLWAFVEDEMMLGKSSGIYNDTIEINGNKQLVKVLKIGKIALFFKTTDEKYGMISKQNGKWEQQSINKEEDIANLAHLYDSFSKQIRTGKFTIKNILPNG